MTRRRQYDPADPLWSHCPKCGAVPGTRCMDARYRHDDDAATGVPRLDRIHPERVADEVRA